MAESEIWRPVNPQVRAAIAAAPGNGNVRPDQSVAGLEWEGHCEFQNALEPPRRSSSRSFARLRREPGAPAILSS